MSNFPISVPSPSPHQTSSCHANPNSNSLSNFLSALQSGRLTVCWACHRQRYVGRVLDSRIFPTRPTVKASRPVCAVCDNVILDQALFLSHSPLPLLPIFQCLWFFVVLVFGFIASSPLLKSCVSDEQGDLIKIVLRHLSASVPSTSSVSICLLVLLLRSLEFTRHYFLLFLLLHLLRAIPRSILALIWSGGPCSLQTETPKAIA